MKEWKRRESTKVTKVGYRTIVSKTFETPDGKVGTFDTMWPDGQEFACGIMITPENEVVIARQFRIGPEKIMDELPGGGLRKMKHQKPVSGEKHGKKRALSLGKLPIWAHFTKMRI